MDLFVRNPHFAVWGECTFRCAIGRGGFVTAEAKKEGDGGTPVGRWKMREVIYRSDREASPATMLPVRAMQKNDGWCDSIEDPNYNRFVEHPYAASAEQLWREDHLYDVVVVLGYNDDPVVAGKGSAIFLHISRPDFSPSAGCVTLAREDLLTVLREADGESSVVVEPTAPDGALLP